MADPFPVAVYYRMSDDRQENSIDRQRSQVGPYCQAHGYTIVREYVDPGIAGDEITKRKEFQRMLRDAQGGAFVGIVCDDKDRFGRFDSIDLGEIVAPLRRKGVWLESVAQGRMDWNSFAGRITDAILQEAKSMELDAISRRVLTGQLLRAQQGFPTGNRPLYGYQWAPDPERGKRYVPDGLKAEAVRLIFRMYDHGSTMCAIAEELYRRGVASPRGKMRWRRSVIQRTLRNRRYVGDWTWGVNAMGKRHRYGKGGVRAKERSDPAAAINAPEDWVVRRDHHEPLIERETFERVQGRLIANQGRTTPAPGGGNFVLSKILVCGHCGSFLVGLTQAGKRKYVCGGYLAYGKGYCKKNAVPEKTMVGFLVRKLQATFLDPGNLRKLRDEMALVQNRQRSADNRQRLQREAKALGDKIDRGVERLTTVDADLMGDVAVKVREWKEQRVAVQAELRRIENDSPVDRLEEEIAAAEGVLWRLSDALEAEDVPLLRQLLRELVARVELHWTHEEKKRLTRCRLDRGEVVLRSSEVTSDLSPWAAR
jgi:site-specific DNA recombinase